MTRTLRISALFLAAALVAVACGPSGSTLPPASGGPAASPSAAGSGPAESVAPGAGGSINVLSLWGGSEEEAFKAVLADFTAKTGVTVNYEADRQTYSTTLQSRITGGNPPDIAIIPGIGFLRRFAKDGSLKKIADMGVDTASLSSSYPEGFLAAGTVDGELYAIPAKYNNKGTMWYRPDVYTAAGVTANPTTWEDFKGALDATVGKPGAMALGAKDDWNLTDWFENIYIRQAGVEA
jgi:alpha-glucoside transport system substrate-binding protein